MERMGFRGCATAAGALLAAALVVACTGADCDAEARATFRETATGPIGEGVKSIVNGVLDGWIATIQEAGDGGSDSGESGAN